MDDLIRTILQQVGGQWLGVAVLVALVLDRTGLIKLWFAGRASERELRAAEAQRERELIAANQQRLIENLREEIDDLRTRRRDDQAISARLFGEQTARIDQLLADAGKWRDDAAKWRHLAGNLGVYVNRLRDKLRASGIDVPKFDGWAKFLDMGGDPNEFPGLDPD